MKKRIKVTAKLLESLGVDVEDLQLGQDSEIKRFDFDGGIEPDLEADGDNYSVGTITYIGVDADGDVLLPQGIDTRRYEKNPVVLFQHNLNMPIGYAEKLIVNEDGIVAKTKYGSTAEAVKVHQLLKDKVLRTHSVGFITLEALHKGGSGFDSALSSLKARFPAVFPEEKSQKVARIITKALLVEYSVVTIPANEDAVITEVKAVKGEEKETKAAAPGLQSPVETTGEATGEAPKKKEDKSLPPAPEDGKIEIKILKRASNIRKVATADQVKCRKAQDLYLKLWGI